jgi:hypothetical protein
MSVPFRQLKLACILVCGLLSVQVTDSRADNALSEQVLDGVCKTELMPAGFVAVGEMESPECKASPPGQKNAWLIDKVHDKIISCALPDYAHGYPPAIAYMSCERVQASQCPPSFDGTPNGFLLTTGTSCTNLRVKSSCFRWDKNYGLTPDDYNLFPEGTFNIGSVPNFKELKQNSNAELGPWNLSIVSNDGSCSKSEGPDRKFYVETLREGEPLPLCAAFNGFSGLPRALSSHNELQLNTKVDIPRQFYTPLCPEYTLNGRNQALNAFVVIKISTAKWINRDLFMCAVHCSKSKSQLRLFRAVGVESWKALWHKTIGHLMLSQFSAFTMMINADLVL